MSRSPSRRARRSDHHQEAAPAATRPQGPCAHPRSGDGASQRDRKSTRLNSSHLVISYAVFCLKKKKTVILIPIGITYRSHNVALHILDQVIVRLVLAIG